MIHTKKLLQLLINCQQVIIRSKKYSSNLKILIIMREINNIVIDATGSGAKETIDSLLDKIDKDETKQVVWHILVEKSGAFKIVKDFTLPARLTGKSDIDNKSIFIGYIGGLSGKDDRTDSQKRTMESLVELLRMLYPSAVVIGVKDFMHDKRMKSPFFDAIKEYSSR